MSGAPVSLENGRVVVLTPDHPVLEAALSSAPATPLRRALEALPTNLQRHGDVADHHLEVGMIIYPRPSPHATGPEAKAALRALAATRLPTLLDETAARPLALRRAQLNRMSQGAYNGLHRDLDDDPSYLLAAILLLSGPDDYEGGELQFPDVGLSIRPASGTLLLFHPALPHAVRPVRGAQSSRRSLVLLLGPREAGGWTAKGWV